MAGRLKSIDLDRIERIYLASLRVAVLGVATLCLVGAIFFGVNALWRVFVSTEVREDPVEVTGAQLAQALQQAAPEEAARADGENAIPAAVRQRHAAWARDFFSRYYAVYQAASQSYKKPEDETLSSQQLMEALGYDLDSFVAGDLKAVSLITDTNYQGQALAAVTTAMADAAVVSQLREYKAAEKTAQSCSTTYQRRRVWDSYSTACYGWWQEPQGCEVTRSVPVERCVPAYPDGIVSPRVAFGRVDGEFFRLWEERSEAVAAEARAIRGERQAIRGQIGPNLMLALQIIGAFLVVMFFFLMVAIERHLRAVRPAPVPGSTAPDGEAGEVGERSDDAPADDPDPPITPRWAKG